MNDAVVGALQFSLAGLDQATKVAANNIANDQTPGFTASVAHWSSSLRAAVAARVPATAHSSTTLSTAPAGTDGNNVNLTTQIDGLQKDNLQQSADVAALNYYFSTLNGSMGGVFN